MGVPTISTQCERCGVPFPRPDAEGAPRECAVCLKLGDRSLLWFLRAYKGSQNEGERADVLRRFHAAKGRST